MPANLSGSNQVNLFIMKHKYFCHNQTLAHKIRHNYGKLKMPDYLVLLRNLSTTAVDEDMLVSQDKSDMFLETITTSCTDTIVYNFPFQDKSKLKEIINKHCVIDQPHLLFTEYSEECGPLKLRSLNDFNLEFSFDAEPSGLIIFYAIDKSYSLMLDYYEEYGKYLINVKFTKYLMP